MDFKTKGGLWWVKYVIYSVRYRGLWRTCSLGISEWRKERQLGIRTFGPSDTGTPSGTCARPCGGHLHQPSSSVLFHRAIGELPFRPGGKVFVDIGSGKGRAMVLAAEAGFSKVIGVELSEHLVRQAEKNLQCVKERFPNTGFELHRGDALAFRLPDKVDVIYLFNPFDSPMLNEWLKHMLPTLTRPVHIIYMHPVYQQVFESHAPQVTLVSAEENREFVIYRADTPVTARPGAEG